MGRIHWLPPLRSVSLVFFSDSQCTNHYATEPHGGRCVRGGGKMSSMSALEPDAPPLSIHYMLVCENRLALPHLHGGRRGRKSPCRMQRASEVKNTRTIDIGKFNIARARYATTRQRGVIMPERHLPTPPLDRFPHCRPRIDHPVNSRPYIGNRTLTLLA